MEGKHQQIIKNHKYLICHWATKLVNASNKLFKMQADHILTAAGTNTMNLFN